jgi:hypothetical protein
MTPRKSGGIWRLRCGKSGRERFVTKRAKSETIELKASHVVYLSKPKEVAALIEKAAQASK